MPTTQSAIRDRVKALIEALTPSALASDRFRSHRNEAGANFEDWAEKNPTSALRRFQARSAGPVEPLFSSNNSTERRPCTIEVRIAYPATARYGAAQALDRDDVIDSDFTVIDLAVGAMASANFSATGAIPLGASKRIERGSSCDFLIVTQSFHFDRTT